jgi:hypothetical protein
MKNLAALVGFVILDRRFVQENDFIFLMLVEKRSTE